MYGEKNLLICEAATACKTNVTSTLTETKLLSLFQAKPTKLDHKKSSQRSLFLYGGTFCYLAREATATDAKVIKRLTEA